MNSENQEGGHREKYYAFAVYASGQGIALEPAPEHDAQFPGEMVIACGHELSPHCKLAVHVYKLHNDPNVVAKRDLPLPGKRGIGYYRYRGAGFVVSTPINQEVDALISYMRRKILNFSPCRIEIKHGFIRGITALSEDGNVSPKHALHYLQHALFTEIAWQFTDFFAEPMVLGVNASEDEKSVYCEAKENVTALKAEHNAYLSGKTKYCMTLYRLSVDHFITSTRGCLNTL